MSEQALRFFTTPWTIGISIALVLAVDAFMDMGRTATNVIGNSIACAVIAKWEGLLGDPKSDTPAVEGVLGSSDGQNA